MYGASAATAPTVVNSLTWIVEELLNWPHEPSATISRSAALFVPAARPGFPPLANR